MSLVREISIERLEEKPYEIEWWHEEKVRLGRQGQS